MAVALFLADRPEAPPAGAQPAPKLVEVERVFDALPTIDWRARRVSQVERIPVELRLSSVARAAAIYWVGREEAGWGAAPEPETSTDWLDAIELHVLAPKPVHPDDFQL